MKKNFISIAVFLFVFNFAKGQGTSLYEKHFFVQGGDTMPYRLLLPVNYNSHKAYPLILFLHGSGERGDDNEKQLVHGGSLFITDSFRIKYPAIVVFPQCAESSFWAKLKFYYDAINKKGSVEFNKDIQPTLAMKLLLSLFKNIEENYPLDKSRMYVGGLSMGGMGTFELVSRMPKTFAAAFAICGAADPATAKQMTNTAWWIFHGLKDPVVDPKFSEDMGKALETAGAQVKLTLYPEDGHDSWDDAFKEPGFFPWLFAHKK